MNQLEPFKKIRTFIFDVDGVLTNSQLLITEEGALLRSMNTRDGLALKMALNEDYRICIITGGNSEGVEKRLKGLGIRDYFSGISDKVEVYNSYVEGLQLAEEEILYMGDDLPDWEVMQKVGLPTCPHDAATEIKETAEYVSPVIGGAGCVRDVIEQTLRVQGKWADKNELGW